MIPAGKWAFISLPLGLPKMSVAPKHMSMFSHVDIHQSTGWSTGLIHFIITQQAFRDPQPLRTVGLGRMVAEGINHQLLRLWVCN